jgi:hypothetical protein
VLAPYSARSVCTIGIPRPCVHVVRVRLYEYKLQQLWYKIVLVLEQQESNSA